MEVQQGLTDMDRAKRINVVYFFDGTSNDRHRDEYKDWSNIVRLHDMIPTDAPDGVEQWKFYGDGVGTRVNETILGSSGGVGLDRRIQESYRHLGSVCRKARERGLEPHVYIFGFSRGAYAARWFAALVDFCGVPASGAPFDAITECFRRKSEESVRDLESKGLLDPKPVIDFLGLFDTVKTTLFRGVFDLAKLPSAVVKCCHALAYHERRSMFPVERFAPDPGRVEEAWFLGSHSDIGGGYVERGLADLTLEWIVENARVHGLYVSEGPIEGDRSEHRNKYHDSMSKVWGAVSLFCFRRPWKNRELLSGDVFHWSARPLIAEFLDREPRIPDPNSIAFLPETKTLPRRDSVVV